MSQATRKQVYVLPIEDGWAAVSYGDEVAPDDEIIPLPLTSQVDYDHVLAFVAGTPLGQDAYIDGWATADDLARWEPELARRTR